MPINLRTLLWVSGLVATVSFKPTTDQNMNGETYLLQPTPHGQKAVGNWSTEFRDYPGGVEYFEVYAGPITTTYGEVFWTGLPPAPLPAHLVKRFDNKVMAVVGFEADQVRRTPQGDVSVPITVAYNHHYGARLIGKGSSMKKVRRSETTDHRAMHPGPDPGWAEIPVEHTPSLSGQPTSMVFGYSNGGEFRKTYHGLVPPFAQLVDSPVQVHCTPMQIDTWNREEMNVTGGKFVAGPAPKHALAPTTGPDAIYSGLLECPLTTRIRKQLTGGGWNDSFRVQLNPCAQELADAPACFKAAKHIGLADMNVTTAQGLSDKLPSGCSVRVNASSKSAQLFFNGNNRSLAGCGGPGHSITGRQETALATLGLLMDPVGNNVTITISGPADVWFGIGFDTQYMANAPYTIVVDGKGGVTERVLGEHVAGILLNRSVDLAGHVVQDGIRTVTLTRSLKGLTPHHHTFDPSQMSLDFIVAIGSGSAFAYHANKTTDTIALWPDTSAQPDPTAAGGLFSLFTAPPATPGSGNNKFRNNFDGEVGYEITPMQTLTVTALGRSGAALKAAARVNIWDVATEKVVASAVIGPHEPKGSVDGGYTYVNLTRPIALARGATYRVTLGCTPGMPDTWVDTNVNAASALDQLATIGDGFFSNALGHFPYRDGSNNKDRDPTATLGTCTGLSGYAGCSLNVPWWKQSKKKNKGACCNWCTKLGKKCKVAHWDSKRKVCHLFKQDCLFSPTAPGAKTGHVLCPPWSSGPACNGLSSSSSEQFPDMVGSSNKDHDPPHARGRWAGIATFKVQVPAHPQPDQQSPPATCVCDLPAAPFGQGTGTLKYLPTGETLGFPRRCNLGDADFSVVKNRNPTCDIRTYVGGLATCHHGWHLLDAEQPLPWLDQPISYYIKFRLYFQEFTPAQFTPAQQLPASHINAFDITWSIAGQTGEYDVPQCAPGTPTDKCTHEISGTIVPPGTDYHFVAAHYHCHAPTCLSLEIWNNRTGELLCKEAPYHGGAAAMGSDAQRFDEPGYIAQRVCLWGTHPPFEYPPLVSGEPLWVKAVTNSTYGHHGEMALPQMLLARLPPRQ